MKLNYVLTGTVTTAGPQPWHHCPLSNLRLQRRTWYMEGLPQATLSVCRSSPSGASNLLYSSSKRFCRSTLIDWRNTGITLTRWVMEMINVCVCVCVCVHVCEWVIWGGGQVMYVFIVCVCMCTCVWVGYLGWGGQVMYVFIVCVCVCARMHTCVHTCISVHIMLMCWWCFFVFCLFFVLGWRGVYICVRVCVCVWGGLVGTMCQDSRLLYYLIRGLKTWLNINHITVHNNKYFIF